VAVGNGGKQRTTRNSLRSAGVPDPEQHIFSIPTVDRETVEIDNSQPQTVFAQVHVDSDPDPDFYADVQEMVDDFLGHEATLNLFPDIVVHNRFSPLEEQVAEPELIAEPLPGLPTPEGKRSRKKKNLCDLGYLEKTKKKQELAKKRLMQRVDEKSRCTFDPTGGYGSLDEHSSDDEEEEIIQNRRVKRKGGKGVKPPTTIHQQPAQLQEGLLPRRLPTPQQGHQDCRPHS
jgi:hypothetical protein